MMQGNTILVTGASGLIGRQVLARLRREGRSAIGIDRLVARGAEDCVEVDLGDIHRLHALVRQHGINSVIHCGAVSGPMVMIDNPAGIVTTNVVGTTNMLELARIYGFRRLVFCSSTSAYGPTDAVGSEAVAETASLRPSSVYGATKVAGEQLLAAYRLQHKVDAVAIRISWVYGPGRTTDCVVRTMLQGALAGDPVHIPYGADFPRQFIYVDDAVSALLSAHDAPECPGVVYNATGDSWETIEAIAGRVRALFPQASITVASGPDPLDDYQHRFDISAISEDLGFHPSHTLESGIHAYADWLRLNTTNRV